MKISRKANTIGALMIATGAVVTGASITSGAMAADDGGDTPTANAVVIGSASADGDAYQCEFDDVELPTIAVVPQPGDLDGEAGVAVDAGGSAGGTGIVLGPADGAIAPPDPDGALSIAIGDDGVPVLSAVSPDGTPIDLGDVQLGDVQLGDVEFGVAVGGAGSVSVDRDGQIVIADIGELPEGVSPMPPTATPVEVREGTPEECATLLEQTSAMPASPDVPAATTAP